MTHPKEDGFSVTHSEPVRQPLACQKCGGEIQGWTCQGCGQVFRENDAGALVFAPMEAVAWREKVARDCLFWRDGEEMKLSVKQAIAAEVDWLAGEIGAAERGKATTRKSRKQYVKGEAVNRIGYAILAALQHTEAGG